MHIRIATPDDAKSIAIIQVAAWKSAYTSFLPATFLDNMNAEQHSEIWLEALSKPSPGFTAVLLNEAGILVGFCVYGPSRDAVARNLNIGELVALNIHPSEWRKGLGRALCQFVLAHAACTTWDAVTLWVISGNDRARRFYEKIGFWLDGAEKQDSKLVGSLIHEVRYRLNISN